MTKVREFDWIEAGIQMLIQYGFSGLSINYLAKFLNVTKGSFYHHFKNQAQFQDKLMTYWEEKNTQQLMDMGKIHAEGKISTKELFNLMSEQSVKNASVELAIRTWARKDDRMKRFLERFDHRRLAIVMDMMVRITGREGESDILAYMLYTMMVGCYSIMPPIEGDHLRVLINRFENLCQASNGN